MLPLGFVPNKQIFSLQNHCAGKDPQDVSKELAVLPVTSVTTDPERIYYTTDLVMLNVRYTSKGDFLEGRRSVFIGSITLKNGSVCVR